MVSTEEIINSCFLPKIETSGSLILAIAYDRINDLIFATTDVHFENQRKHFNSFATKMCVALGEETYLPVSFINGHLPKIGDVVENKCNFRRWIITEITNI